MAILVGARRGEADEIPGVSIHWVAPATCPAADELGARVRRLLPGDAAVVSPADRLAADGTVEWVNGQYRLKLSVGRERQPARVVRVFESDSCESLAGAAAVTLALLVRRARAEAHPGAVALESPSTPPGSKPSSDPQTSAKGPPSPAPVAPIAPPPAAREGGGANSTNPSVSAPRSVALEGPLVAVDQGVLPSWAYGLGFGIGFRTRRIRVMLTGVLWLPQDSSAGSPYVGRYERLSGGLSGCYGWPVGPFDIGPCLKVTLEDVTANGTGPDVVGASAHTTWLTMGLGARAAWSVRRWGALFLRPSLAFTTSRPTFAIDGVGPLYQVPLVSGGVDLGCEWIL